MREILKSSKHPPSLCLFLTRAVHPDVAGISFTGGTVTGKKIAGSAGPKLKKLQLELGGKNPTIVFKDRYFEETLQLQGVAFAGLANTVYLHVFSFSQSHLQVHVVLSVHAGNESRENLMNDLVFLAAVDSLPALP